MRRVLLALIVVLVPAWGLAVSSEEYYSAGMRLFKQKDFEKAILYFHAAIEQNPDMWQAYEYLGESYFQTANRTEALVAIRRSLELHPNNPELKEFMNKIESPSPWVSGRSFQSWAAYLSLAISLLTLVWVALWTRKYTPRPRP